jgi:2-dehydropantoate 2-reductase
MEIAMRILMMGAGALGGYFGGRLAAAGHDVTFIARGAHLAALQADGLRIESPFGDLHLREVRALADPGAAPTPDIAFLLVKNYDLEAAAEALRPALGAATCVVTLQNGVSAPDRLAEIIGPERVVPGVAYIPADLRAPGVVRHNDRLQRLIFGPPPAARPLFETLMADFTAAGIDASLEADIRPVLWTKFIMLSAMSALTALTRLDLGPIRDCPESRALLRQAVDETAAVARAACPGVPDGIAETQFSLLTERFGPHVHASMLDDLRAGKRLEVNYLSGDVARIGARLGVPTPLHSFVAAALQPYAYGAPA